MNDNNNGNDMLGNLLDLISIVIGYQNLIENREQSEANDVQKANQEQEKHILNDLHAKFDEQNKILAYQNALLKEILDLLKGENGNEL